MNGQNLSDILSALSQDMKGRLESDGKTFEILGVKQFCQDGKDMLRFGGKLRCTDGRECKQFFGDFPDIQNPTDEQCEKPIRTLVGLGRGYIEFCADYNASTCPKNCGDPDWEPPQVLEAYERWGMTPRSLSPGSDPMMYGIKDDGQDDGA